MDGKNKQILRLDGVSKGFGGLNVISDLDMKIEEGEIRGLIGPNGSGKTTLINLITGIYRIDRGAIYFLEDRVDGRKSDQIASLGIMRTFQISRNFRDMTLIENMIVPALTQGSSMRDARNKAEDLLKFVLLDKLKDQPAKNLSGGQNMLLQIVKGFMNHKLRLYIMDEPFAGVHDTIKGTILSTIRTMNQQKGLTFLVVSHEMTTIKEICQKISVLHKGRIISEGLMEEIAEDPEVIDAYLGGR
jgi:branched-chain amino acid transport system ATP-binding protein